MVINFSQGDLHNTSKSWNTPNTKTPISGFSFFLSFKLAGAVETLD